jgi:hypothetical protein
MSAFDPLRTLAPLLCQRRDGEQVETIRLFLFWLAALSIDAVAAPSGALAHKSLQAGMAVYVPGNTGHRTANVGDIGGEPKMIRRGPS